MEEQPLFTDEIWNKFLIKFGEIESEFKLKTYPHFDPYFNFFKNSNDIKKIVSDQKLVAKHPFLPFVKILTKTPRYRYQENEKTYSLESKIRPIAFASHFDSYIYSFYSHVLTEIYQRYIKDEKFDECILAYRTDLDGKCNIQFAKDVFDIAKNKIEIKKECVAIALDITGYFDNIDHKILKDKWCAILKLNELPKDQYKIYRSLTKYSYVNKNSILKHFDVNLKKTKGWNSLLDFIPSPATGDNFKEKFNLLRKKRLIVTNKEKIDSNGTKSNRGIPQGSPMSALLSNIYLIDFDKKIFLLSKTYNFTYRRYCDDILIICDPENTKQINKIILDEISKYSLVIQPKKTELIHFKPTLSGKIRGFNLKKIEENSVIINNTNEKRFYKNLQYLGFEFSGTNIYIRPGSLSRYFRKMKGRIIKTIMMSYSDKSKIDKILKKQIFERYSHLGKRNFLSYAIKSSKDKYYSKSLKKNREGLNSISIRKQISSHFAILEKEIKSKSEQRFSYKEYIHEKKIEENRRTKKPKLKS